MRQFAFLWKHQNRKNAAAFRSFAALRGELGRTGRYGVYFDLTGPKIEFWVEEFGKPGFLICIKHQDAGTVLDYVRKRCDELRLIEP